MYPESDAYRSDPRGGGHPGSPLPPQGPQGPYGSHGSYGSQGAYGAQGGQPQGSYGAGAYGPGAGAHSAGAHGAGSPGSQGAGAGGPAPVKRKRRTGLVIGGVVALLLAVACLGGGYLASQDEPARAKVGDCVSQTGEDDLDIVECGSADAAYKVVGRLEDKTQTEAQLSACSAYVSAGASAVYWEGRTGEPGTVLCLAKAS